jgi:N-acetylglucosamine-6-sulfatase
MRLIRRLVCLMKICRFTINCLLIQCPALMKRMFQTNPRPSAKTFVDADELASADDKRRRQILTLVALDRKIGEILAKLKETG